MKNTTLVLGASLKSERYSNMVIRRLNQQNFEVKAFGIKNGIVDGVKIDSVLIEYDDVDTITLYLNPKRQKEYYDYMLRLRPNRVIFNPGTENPELYNLLKENNIEVEVACTLVLLGTGQY